jgi:drug/metabolite transporter (DMT)-like permease
MLKPPYFYQMQQYGKWVLFLLLSLIWGSSFELMKIGMGGGSTLTAYQVAALRVFSAGLVFAPRAIFAIKRVPVHYWPTIILSGCIGSLFPAFLFCIAETRINASLAGILNALTPLFTIVVGISFFKYKATLTKWAGILLGLLALILLPILSGKSFSGGQSWYALLVVLATLLYGINLCMVGTKLKAITSLDIVSIAFAALLIPTGLFLYANQFFSLLAQSIQTVQQADDTWQAALHNPIFISVFASVLLGVVGTGLASVLFYKLVKQAGYIFASMVAYGIPLVALMIGFATHETIGLAELVCLVIILLGVALVNKK